MLDNGRAVIAGCQGEFNYDAPMDQHIIKFLGLDVAALREQLAAGKGDGEILAWVQENAKHQRTPWEIEQWSDYQQRRGPDGDVETLEFFAGMIGKFSKTREDIKTWFDALDLDDYATFGGRP
jgi:Domain of unknown function (DUF5069)